MKPKTYPEIYCSCKERLEPHISSMHGRRIVNGTRHTYRVGHWYCPKCGLMYHFKEHESIIKETVQ